MKFKSIKQDQQSKPVCFLLVINYQQKKSMIAPFIEQQQINIGLFTFYKSQQNDHQDHDAIDQQFNHSHPLKNVPLKIHAKSLEKNGEQDHDTSFKPFNNQLLCENFLRNTRLKKQKFRFPKVMRSKEQGLFKSEAASQRINTHQQEFMILHKQPKHNRPDQLKLSDDKKIQSHLILVSNMNSYESISEIRKKYFKREGISKIHQNHQNLTSKSQNEINVDPNAQLIKSQLFSFEKNHSVQSIKNQKNNFKEKVQFYDRKNKKKYIQTKKASIKQKSVELSNKNQFYFKKMIENIGSDHTVYNKIFRQSWKIADELHLSNRVKTQGNYSQFSKERSLAMQTNLNFSKLALKLRQTSIKLKRITGQQTCRRLNSFK